MSNEFTFYVLTSAYDHQDKNILDNIISDQWCNWKENTKVYYQSDLNPRISQIASIIKEIQPDVIFINGLFSPVYNFKALIAAKQFIRKIHNSIIILSPRGMLHSGALSQKKFKKRLFLNIIILLGLYKNVIWHATDEKEVHFIRNKFGKAKIHMAANFPKIFNTLESPIKKNGELIMGTLALISPMKNHLEILHALKYVNNHVIWHVFGPIKDLAYWNQCNEIIIQLPSNIQVIYHGATPPVEVASALQKIQVFILPSKSENFGHAIFEALSAGKPVITTNTTPFIKLSEKKAGQTIDINQLELQLTNAIDYFAKMNAEEFSVFQNGAVDFANNFVNMEKLKEQYRAMFEIQ